MRIELVPARWDDALVIEKSGDALTVNGEVFDFSQMPDDSTLPAGAVSSRWFFGPVEKRDGELMLKMVMPIPANFSPEQAFPADLVAVPDGPVRLPQPLPAIAEVNDEH